MKIPAFGYHRPTSVEEVTGLLAKFGDDAKVLAGGQSLLPLMALRLSRPAHVIDLGGVEGLDVFSRGECGELVVGCMVRHSAMESYADAVKSAPLAAAAMPHIGHRAIRNRGTVCGSIAHADPAAELPAVAVATDASMVVRSRHDERVVAARDFFNGYLTCDVASDELLLELRIPSAADGSFWSLKEVTRRHGDFALIGLAAGLEFDGDGRIGSARLAFFGAASTPLRVDEAESVLVGERPGEELFEVAAAVVADRLNPPSDLHGSAAYRKHLAAVLTRRCLADMSGEMRGMP